MTPRDWNSLDDTDDHMPPGDPVRMATVLIYMLIALMVVAVVGAGMMVGARG